MCLKIQNLRYFSVICVHFGNLTIIQNCPCVFALLYIYSI